MSNNFCCRHLDANTNSAKRVLVCVFCLTELKWGSECGVPIVNYLALFKFNMFTLKKWDSSPFHNHKEKYVWYPYGCFRK